MSKKFWQKVLDIVYPRRDFEVVKIGDRYFNVTHDSLGEVCYSLQGVYSFDKVKSINELTTYSARYGYCNEIGNVALIGIPNSETDWAYFEEVSAFGEYHSRKEYKFEKYSEEYAKHLKDFKVYGISGIEKIVEHVKFDKITRVYDVRFKERRISHEYRDLEMMAKLEGKYTFGKAKRIAQKQQKWAVDRGMAYATLEDNTHVAIMSFWYDKKDEVRGFKDVWESGKPEPATQKITFMTEEEAKGIKDFSIYLYDYNFFYVQGKAPKVVKLNRTLEPDFDFYDTPDGKDMRIDYEYLKEK